jgi:hypothetical protein
VKRRLFQIESLVLGLVVELLEIVLFDTQQSRDVIEDIERAKGNSASRSIASVASQMPNYIVERIVCFSGTKDKIGCCRGQLHSPYVIRQRNSQTHSIAQLWSLCDKHKVRAYGHQTLEFIRRLLKIGARNTRSKLIHTLEAAAAAAYMSAFSVHSPAGGSLRICAPCTGEVDIAPALDIPD